MQAVKGRYGHLIHVSTDCCLHAKLERMPENSTHVFCRAVLIGCLGTIVDIYLAVTYALKYIYIYSEGNICNSIKRL